MRLDMSQQLRLQQQMRLAPRIIQAMEILQLPMLELQERIDTEMESNPVLELKADGVDEQAPPAQDDYAEDRGERDMVVDDSNGHSDDFERLANLADEYGPDIGEMGSAPRGPRPAAGERDRKLDAMANTPAREESLNEYLLEQWAFVETGAAGRLAGELIINEIDEDGFLRTPLEDLSARADPPLLPAQLAEALALVQRLEPLGVGARDLKECLLIQLAAETAAGRDVALEAQLVEHFLRDIEMNRLPQIAKRTGRSVEDIKAALTNLSHLNPRPGSLIGHRVAPVIRPDAIVDLDEDGNVLITMADGNTPHLRISRTYRKFIRDKSADREARQFIRKNIQSAQWLLSAIDQRRETVRRVVEEVFAVQSEFLVRGEEALKSLPMADVAGAVGVHVATVSRAVAGKHVQTPRGIFRLRTFFSGGTTNAQGDDVAWDAVKAKLQEIIDNEDKAKPLNDDRLAAELEKHGLKIARRTVAKYRSILNIPPARKRRQY